MNKVIKLIFISLMFENTSFAQNIFGPEEIHYALSSIKELANKDSLSSNLIGWHCVEDTIKLDIEYINGTWTCSGDEIKIGITLYDDVCYSIIIDSRNFEINCPNYCINGRLSRNGKKIRSLKYRYGEKYCRIVNRNNEIAYRNRFIPKENLFPEKSLTMESGKAIFELSEKFLLLQ